MCEFVCFCVYVYMVFIAVSGDTFSVQRLRDYTLSPKPYADWSHYSMNVFGSTE